MVAPGGDDHDRRRTAARRGAPADRRTGSAGDRTSASGPGAPCARTTAPTAPPGTTSRTITPARAPTAGTRTASPASATATRGSASRWRCGTAAIRSSRSGCSASPATKATTARTSRSTTSTSTPRRPTRTCGCSTSIRRRRFPTPSWSTRTGAAVARAPEFELIDTGVFDDDRYFDVFVEYAKADADDMLMRITVVNRGPEAAPLHVLPTVWFRNTWSWNGDARKAARCDAPPSAGGCAVDAGRHAALRHAAGSTSRARPQLLFTENETNTRRLFGDRQRPAPTPRTASTTSSSTAQRGAVNPARTAPRPPRTTRSTSGRRRRQPSLIRLRLSRRTAPDAAAIRWPTRSTTIVRAAAARGRRVLRARSIPRDLSDDERRGHAPGLAGLLWSKQFYHYVVKDWLDGDPAQPPPPPERQRRAQPRVDASLQRRRHLDAGQVGVPVVRGVGPGVPLRPARARRLRLRQGAARS